MSKGLPNPESWYSWRTNSVNDNFDENTIDNDALQDEDYLNIIINEIAKNLEDTDRDFSSDDVARLKNQRGKVLKQEGLDENSHEELKKSLLEAMERQKTYAGMSRNELDLLRGRDYRERIYERPKSPKRDLVEPLLTSRVYEVLMSWIPMQEAIIGCIYDLSDLVILEKLLDIDYLELIVDVRGWLKEEKPGKSYRTDRAKYLEEIDKGANRWLSFYDHPDDYGSMHQKWVMGHAKPELNREKTLIYGSYNFSDNAKKNIESALFFPLLTPGLHAQFRSDFEHLRAQTKYLHSWSELKNKYKIRIE